MDFITYTFFQFYNSYIHIWVIMVVVIGNGSSTPIFNLDKTACISFCANTLGKGMKPITLASSYEQVVGQTELINFGMTTNLEEAKVWIKTSCTLVKNWGVFCLLWRGWINTPNTWNPDQTNFQSLASFFFFFLQNNLVSKFSTFKDSPSQPQESTDISHASYLGFFLSNSFF